VDHVEVSVVVGVAAHADYGMHREVTAQRAVAKSLAM
jgi:hypothetical protein